MRLKLGQVNRHHASHREQNERCPASHPETALHINTKLYLASQLEAAAGPEATLAIERRCLVGDPALKRRSAAADVRVGLEVGGAGLTQPDVPHAEGHGLQLWWEIDAIHCARTDSQEWTRGWDEVRVEDRVTGPDAMRVPDITLRRAGDIVGAIEVFASNAVSLEKAAVLARLGVPWIEVRAEQGVYSGASAWTPSVPLRVVREGGRPLWRCPDHQRQLDAARERERVAAEEAAREAARAVEAARHKSRVLAARVVDINYRSGKWYRHVYVVREHATDDVVHSVTLHRSRDLVTTIEVQDPGDPGSTEHAARRVTEHYRSDVKAFIENYGAIIDSPMRWARGTVAVMLLEAEAWDRSRYAPQPLLTRYPRRYRYIASQQRWWLPPDQIDVRWDRAGDDNFGEHPAYRRAREAARDKQQQVRQPGLRGPAEPGTQCRPATPEPLSSISQLASAAVHAGQMPSLRSTVPLAATITPQELGPVGTLTRRPWGAVIDLSTPPGVSPRAVICLTVPMVPEIEREVERALSPSTCEFVWLSAWPGWSAAYAHLRWLPTARDERRTPLVVFENRGIPAEEFARAFASDDPDLTLKRIAESGATFLRRRLSSGSGRSNT